MLSSHSQGLANSPPVRRKIAETSTRVQKQAVEPSWGFLHGKRLRYTAPPCLSRESFSVALCLHIGCCFSKSTESALPDERQLLGGHPPAPFSPSERRRPFWATNTEPKHSSMIAADTVSTGDQLCRRPVCAKKAEAYNMAAMYSNSVPRLHARINHPINFSEFGRVFQHAPDATSRTSQINTPILSRTRNHATSDQCHVHAQHGGRSRRGFVIRLCCCCPN